MKEITISFSLRVALKRTDLYWVEEELERLRQCERCGSALVRNGQERKEIKTLLGTIRIN